MKYKQLMCVLWSSIFCVMVRKQHNITNIFSEWFYFQCPSLLLGQNVGMLIIYEV